MAANCRKEMTEPEKDLLNDNLPRKVVDQLDDDDDDNDYESSSSDTELEKVPECPVCLQNCIHPVQLPCTHIFCFLCVKGVANQSKRCALCRQEIPVDFLNNPSLVRSEDLLKDTGFEDGYQWFYEGRNGWWQYDERTSIDLEEKYKKSVKAFEILIAGFLYVIDMDNMIQIRRNDPTRRRRIKRDLSTIPKKGVAGLKIATSQRDGADGGETQDNGGNDRVNSHLTPSVINPIPDAVSPRAPNNTPQSPEQGSPGEPASPSQEELSSQMANLTLSPAGRHHIPNLRHRHDRYDRSTRDRLMETSSSSSDTDWD